MAKSIIVAVLSIALLTSLTACRNGELYDSDMLPHDTGIVNDGNVSLSPQTSEDNDSEPDSEYVGSYQSNNNKLSDLEGIADWQRVYSELLRQYATQQLGCEDDDRLGGFFILHDIDNNGIPDLIVANSFHFTNYLAAYSFAYGELATVDVHSFYDYSAPVFVPLDGAPGLVQFFGESWISGAVYLSLDGGRLVAKNHVKHLAGWGTDDGKDTWYVNGTTATQDEFYSAFAEIFGLSWNSSRWNELDEVLSHAITDDNIYEIILGSKLPGNSV